MGFEEEYSAVTEDPYWIAEIIFHSVNCQNDLLDNILQNIISENQPVFRDKIRQILCQGKFPESLDESVEYQPGTVFGLNQLEGVVIDIELLETLTATNYIVDQSIFEHLFSKFVKDGKIYITQVKNFLRLVSETDKELLSDYFSIIEQIILDHYNPDQENPIIDAYILDIIVPWASITGTYSTDAIQRSIDTFKIIYQEQVEDFDLETSRPLDIETITTCYKLTNGEIPRFIEGNIQFSFTKPVWDQLARHYLALGLQRPKREAIAKSKLREVPNYLLRDVLGQIALVNQTIFYCERNGFRSSLENLIITNIYKRGWNVERGMERTLPSLLGSTSPRLRAYFATYLIVDQGEISLDLLRWARDVEDYLLRDRIVRELERYGTPDMWIIIANAYHRDIQDRAIGQLKEARMSTTERSQVTIDLLKSPKNKVRALGLDWLQRSGIQQDHLISLFHLRSEDILPTVLSYLSDHEQHFTEEHHQPLFSMIRELLWKPKINQHIRNQMIELGSILARTSWGEQLRQEAKALASSGVKSRLKDAISLLSSLEVP